MLERGVIEEEIVETVVSGISNPARRGRNKFRKVFAYNSLWNKVYYPEKEITVIAAPFDGGFLAITVIARYF